MQKKGHLNDFTSPSFLKFFPEMFSMNFSQRIYKLHCSCVSFRNYNEFFIINQNLIQR